MGIYKETKDYKLIHDNMLNMANYIENGTIDCVITDPPYELGFMGKKWDGSGIAFNVDAWKKCFNALKDGGYLLAFGGTRTFHRIACAIEDAGFEIRDTIMYLYGSGFPKSHNIGLAVDKLNGVESKVLGKAKGDGSIGKNGVGNDTFVAKNQYEDGTHDIKQAQNEWKGWGTALKPAYEPIIVARKPMKTSVAENVLKNGVGGINIDECRVKTDDDLESNYNSVRKSDDVMGERGYKIGFRQGKDSVAHATESTKLGRFPANIIHDGSDEVVSGFPDSEGGTTKEKGSYGFCFDNTKRDSKPMADGYGDSGSASRFFYTAKASKKDRDEGLDAFEFKRESDREHTGRFPANIIHDGSDEVVSGFPETSSGLMTPKHTRHTDGSPNGIYGKFDVNHPLAETYGDSGSASRFFYSAKASKKDRDEGLEHFDTVGRNTHPTVKPTELMQYLIRMVAPKGATILDCFMGSNSTGKAAMFENRERNAKYKFIGIELTDEYLPICEARIEYAINKYEYDEKAERAKTGQISLFDELGE